MELRRRVCSATGKSPVDLGSDTEDVGQTGREADPLLHGMNVVELNFRVSVEIPVQTGGDIGQVSPLDVLVVEVEVGQSQQEFPSPRTTIATRLRDEWP